MKIIITESQLSEIIKDTEVNELFPTSHFKKRIGQRFLGVGSLDVVLSVPYQGTFNDRVVGRYIIPKEVRSEIENKVNYLVNTNIDNKLYLGIVLHKFDKIKVSDIIWSDDKSRTITIKTLQDNYKANLYVSDKETDSRGDILFAIIQDNSILTIEYERKHGLFNNRKDKYDDILMDVEELEKYKIN